jgi:hypothetical protein
MNGVSALVVRDRQNLGIKLQFPSSNFEIRAKKEKGTFWIPNSWSPLDLRLALNQRSAATRETRFINWFGHRQGHGIEYHLLAIALAAVIIVHGAGAFLYGAGAVSSVRITVFW